MREGVLYRIERSSIIPHPRLLLLGEALGAGSFAEEGTLSQVPIKIADRQTYYRTSPSGLYEEVDCVTGVVVAVQESDFPIARSEFLEHTLPDGRVVLVQNTVELWRTEGIKKRIPFSPLLADIIVQKIAEGMSLKKLFLTPGMPDARTLSRWRREWPDFDMEVRTARQLRAESLRDEAVEIGLSADGAHPDDVMGKRLAVDTLKWAAEKDDPATYGPKTKVEHSGSVGVVQLVVETGIRRDGDAGVPPEKEVKDETETMDAGNPETSVHDSANDGSTSGRSSEDHLVSRDGVAATEASSSGVPSGYSRGDSKGKESDFADG